MCAASMGTHVDQRLEVQGFLAPGSSTRGGKHGHSTSHIYTNFVLQRLFQIREGV